MEQTRFNRMVADLLAFAERKGFSQSRLASDLGIDRTCINKAQRSGRTIGVDAVLRIAEHVGYPQREREDITIECWRDIMRTSPLGPALAPMIRAVDDFADGGRSVYLESVAIYADPNGLSAP
jgi:hypothetical protein